MRSQPFRTPKSRSGLSLLLLVACASAHAEKTMAIHTVIQVKATQEQAYTLLKSLRRFPEWSPFLVTDPKQKHYATGVDGEPGSTFHWEGVEERSKGFQTLVQAEGGNYLRFACTMEKPFAGHPVFEYRLVPKEGGVEVWQDFTIRLSPFSYFLTKILGVRKKMSATNKLGLERMKAVLESQERSNPDSDSPLSYLSSIDRRNP